MAAEMAARFEPGTVPLLSRHGGVPLGYLDALVAEGQDLRFTGSVSDDPDLVARLPLGVGISIEPCEGVEPLPAGIARHGPPARPLSETYPHYRERSAPAGT